MNMPINKAIKFGSQKGAGRTGRHFMPPLMAGVRQKE